jgi:uncharacterized membrane protein YdjX (TVP38/TMEM64 family)
MTAVETSYPTSGGRTPFATWARRVGIAIAIAGLALLVWTIWDQQALMRWIENASPLRFFIVMSLLPVVGVPITPFFILAGTTFGIAVGLIVALSALLVQLVLSYWIANSRLRGLFEAMLRRFNYELPDFKGESRSAVRFTLMVKATPGIPNVVKNYGLASAGVPLGVFLVVSMALTGAYGAALVVLGESLFQHQSVRALVAIAVVVVLALLLSRWVKRRRDQAPITA